MDNIYEYWYCVSPQYNLPIYEGKGEKKKLSSDYIVEFVQSFASTPTEERESFVREQIATNPSVIEELRKLVGVSDKRFYLDMTYEANMNLDMTYKGNMIAGDVTITEPRGKLKRHDTKYFMRAIQDPGRKDATVSLIMSYFKSKGLLEILETFSALSNEQFKQIIKNLIDTKETQQADAKYRGHGAEKAFAEVFNYCGVKIVPDNKHIDPMAGYDPNVDLETMTFSQHEVGISDSYSFDLVILDDSDSPAVLVQSLIHSSDPGQYGVNKSDETVEIKRKRDERNERHGSNVALLGSVDGVGFCENQGGTIVKMLNAFDGFFQINTLFKIPIYLASFHLISDFVGVCLDKDYFEKDFIDQFDRKYLSPNGLKLLEPAELENYRTHRAGRGYIAFDK